MAAHGSARCPVAESGNAERSGRHSHGGPWERVRESSITSQYLVRTSVLDHRQSDAPIVPYYNPYDLEFVFNLSTFNSATCAGSAHNKATPSLCWRAVRWRGATRTSGPSSFRPYPFDRLRTGAEWRGSVLVFRVLLTHALHSGEKSLGSSADFSVQVFKMVEWNSPWPGAMLEKGDWNDARGWKTGVCDIRIKENGWNDFRLFSSTGFHFSSGVCR